MIDLSRSEEKNMVYIDIKGGIMTAVPNVSYRSLADKGLVVIVLSKFGKTVVALTDQGKAWLALYYAANRKFTFICSN